MTGLYARFIYACFSVATWFRERLWCHLLGHRWSRFGDEDSDGFFPDPHTLERIRSCTRCWHVEIERRR